METVYIPEKYRILSGADLKKIAVVTMFIDHAAKGILYYGILWPNRPFGKNTGLYSLYQFYRILRMVGRTAFPIYCFFLVQGFLYTRSRSRYALRLFIFALISEIPFDLALENKLNAPGHQNVNFTLLLGLIMLCAIEWIGDRLKDHPVPAVLLQAAVVVLLFQAAYLTRRDYRHRGLMIILAFYLLRFFQPLACAGAAVAAYWEWPAVLPSFFLLLLYSGERGKQNKYFFYIFYPAHLLLIWLIRLVILRFT
ncbi:MAG: TraX family protein [Lachnospiraceae bacterium]|nr:TraX family protein [Lachnospiraceae bacterium]